MEEVPASSDSELEALRDFLATLAPEVFGTKPIVQMREEPQGFVREYQRDRWNTGRTSPPDVIGFAVEEYVALLRRPGRVMTPGWGAVALRGTLLTFSRVVPEAMAKAGYPPVVSLDFAGDPSAILAAVAGLVQVYVEWHRREGHDPYLLTPWTPEPERLANALRAGLRGARDSFAGYVKRVRPGARADILDDKGLVLRDKERAVEEDLEVAHEVLASARFPRGLFRVDSRGLLVLPSRTVLARILRDSLRGSVASLSEVPKESLDAPIPSGGDRAAITPAREADASDTDACAHEVAALRALEAVCAARSLLRPTRPTPSASPISLMT